MSEQPLTYEPAPVDLPDGTEAYFHTERNDLLPYEQAAAFTRAAQMAEKVKVPEVLTLHEQIARITQKTKNMRDYDLAA